MTERGLHSYHWELVHPLKPFKHVMAENCMKIEIDQCIDVCVRSTVCQWKTIADADTDTVIQWAQLVIITIIICVSTANVHAAAAGAMRNDMSASVVTVSRKSCACNHYTRVLLYQQRWSRMVEHPCMVVNVIGLSFAIFAFLNESSSGFGMPKHYIGMCSTVSRALE